MNHFPENVNVETIRDLRINNAKLKISHNQ